MISDDSLVEQLASDWFDRVPGYLDTAAVGLPFQASLEIMRARLMEWEAGECDPRSFDPDVERCRHAFAQIVGSDVSSVGIIGQVSVASGVVTASLSDGSIVLAAEEEFTSALFPFLADRRLSVKTVPFADLIDAIDEGVDLVVVSAVQSNSGVVTDLEQLSEVSQRYGTRTYLDITQAAGWMTIETERFDVTACHGYKWLCSPRGAGFITATEEARTWLKPVNAGWYSGDDPWQSLYGPPLRLAPDARAFNTSPAWFSYASAVPALEALAGVGPEAIGRYSVDLANSFREKVGLDISDSAMVSLETNAGQSLKEAGVAVSSRDGRARLSFYLYNTAADVEMAAEIVREAVQA